MIEQILDSERPLGHWIQTLTPGDVIAIAIVIATGVAIWCFFRALIGPSEIPIEVMTARTRFADEPTGDTNAWQADCEDDEDDEDE